MTDSGTPLSQSSSTCTSSPTLTSVWFGGQSRCRSRSHARNGAVASYTVTYCSQVAVLPQASVAVQVTTVMPGGNVAGASLLTVTSVQVSAATGEPRFSPLAAQLPWSSSISRSAGHSMVGGVVSTGLIICVADVLLPHASVAVQVRETTCAAGPPPGTLSSRHL